MRLGTYDSFDEADSVRKQYIKGGYGTWGSGKPKQIKVFRLATGKYVIKVKAIRSTPSEKKDE